MLTRLFSQVYAAQIHLNRYRPLILLSVFLVLLAAGVVSAEDGVGGPSCPSC